MVVSDPNSLARAPSAVSVVGLQIEEEIGRGAHSVVYRASRGGRSFAVKIQKPVSADQAQAAALRFRREGALLACLRHPGLPAIVALGETEGLPYLVLEFVSGQSLAERLQRGALSQDLIVAIAHQIASALGEVHRAGMVHCDVKPANIMLDESGGGRLIDFGFAVRASAERERDHIAGTLLYAAPEQTGMLKRPLDARSDLYALGVVLFECACGVPPFEAADAGELIRLHAVDAPPDIQQLRPSLSVALVAIINKLLAKDPDDRYQTSAGLLSDLDALEELDKALADDQQVVLGAEDYQPEGLLDTALVGRGSERRRLRRHGARALQRRGTMLLIEGEPGVGKSRVSRELVRHLRRKGALCMVGRCAVDEPLPFAALRWALDGALRRMARLPPQERDEAEARVREAAGDAAGLLASFSPKLAALLGDTRHSTSSSEVSDQYYEALAHFFVRLAAAWDGGLLVIEDVHAMDDGSRRVLSRMAPMLRREPLLVVCTADVSSRGEGSEEADSFSAEMGAGLSARLTLAPMSDRDMAQLVAIQLGHVGGGLECAKRIARRCGGNPLAAKEYVRSMLDAGVLRPDWGQWAIDEVGMQQLDLPTDVATLVVRRIDQLASQTREVLRAAALMGASFERALLVGARDGDETAVNEALDDAVAARVVEGRRADRFAFVHSDVQQGLVSGLSDEELRGTHQRIAQALDEADRDDSDHLYAVARHFALGVVDADPQRVVDANTQAGRRALSEYAHEQAHVFLVQVHDCAAAADIELPADFHKLLGEVCARTGKLSEAIRHYELTLEGTEPRLQRAQLRERLAHSHIANFHTEPAWREALAGFAELGVRIPRWSPVLLVNTLWLWLLGVLASRWAPQAQGERRQWCKIYVNLSEQAAVTAYFANRPLLLANMAARGLHAAARLGPSPELVMSRSQYGVGYAAVGLRYLALASAAAANKMARQIDDRLVLARCHLYHGFVLHLCGDSVEAETVLTRALERHGEWLDAMHFVDGSGDLVFNQVLRGYYREAWQWVEQQLSRLWFTSGGVRARQGNPWAGPLLVALGRLNEGVAQQEQTRAFVEGAPRTERYLWGEMLSYSVLYHMEQGELGEELDSTIAQHRQLRMRPALTSFHMRSFFVFQAHARLEQAMAAKEDARAGRLAELTRAVFELRAAAMIPSMQAHAWLLDGALARLDGRGEQARRCFAEAERLAREVDSPWVLFEVARQRAHLLGEMGGKAAAAREARFALALALEHGWVGRGRKIRAELEVGGVSTQTLSLTATASKRQTSDATSLRLRRQLDALLQVSLAAATVLDSDRQAGNALDETVKILGAERGFLFGCTDEGELELLAGRDAHGSDLAQLSGFSSTVIETVRTRQEPMVLSGSDQGSVIGSESVVRHDLRSIVAAPLQLRDRMVGVIYLDSRLARGVFTEEDVEILQALGNHIAIALEMARSARVEIAVEAEAQKRQLAERLRDLSHALSSSLKLHEVLQNLVEGLTSVVPYDRATVLLVEQEGFRRVLVAAETATAASCGELQLALDGEPVLAEVVSERQTVIVADAKRDSRMDRCVGEEPLASCLALPLICHDQVVGLLMLESTRIGAYTPAEADIAATFAGQVGVAIENARLFGEVQRLARIDELTELLNRRHFFERAEQELARAKRYKRPLSAILLDVDHFKRVNDTYGHAVGDEVLRVVAGRCRETVRTMDILGRYGGEEFVILVPDTSQAGTSEGLAERLRSSIAEEPIASDDGAIAVTISLGVAGLRHDEDDLASLLDRADTALYAAKEGGRNCVKVASSADDKAGSVEGEKAEGERSDEER